MRAKLLYAIIFSTMILASLTLHHRVTVLNVRTPPADSTAWTVFVKPDICACYYTYFVSAEMAQRQVPGTEFSR